MRESGVYQIVNKVNGKRYIGSAVNLRKRWAVHRSDLRRDKHGNIHLQRAWTLYGGKTFAFAVLEYVSDLERLLEREQHYLDALQPEYNIAPVAGSPMSGRQHTAVAREKMSKTRTGRVFSAEHRRKISESHATRVYGPLSASHKQKLSVAMTGRTHTEEAKAKMSEALMGHAVSEETKQNMSKGQVARWANSEHRAALTGDNSPVAKLSERQVREIKVLLKESRLLHREIAAMYGVSACNIGCIKRGLTWSHVQVVN